MTRHILHVDLDAFFVAAEQARDPALRGKPVVVGGDPTGRGVVATASYEARVFGIYSGQPLRTAKRLCPDAIFLRGDYSEYSRVSGIFHKILADYTPLVESGGLDEACLDITGCEQLIGTPQEAAAHIRARIRDELGLAASIGIGTSRMIAKVASDYAKPDGVFAVAEGDEATFLAPMPLRKLPMLGAQTERRLTTLGISTLGQLAVLSTDALEGLFGPHAGHLQQRARGIDTTPVGGEGDSAQKSISREATFSHDVAEPAHLRAVLRGFSESVGSQLRAMRRRGRTVTLKVRYDDFTTISRSHTPPRSVNSNEAIFAAANELLNSVRAHESRPVRLIGVGVGNLINDEVQLTLEPSSAEREDALSATFDRVRRKYGTRSLQTGRTAFDTATASDWVFERHTGLSSQAPQ